MQCTSIRQHFDEFIDAELPSDLDTAVREHLAVCDRCRLEIDRRRAFLGRLRRVARPAAPEGLREEVREALQGRSRQR